MGNNKKEVKTKNSNLPISNVIPRFHFTRFHTGTEHSGFEIAIFGIVFKYMKFPNFKKYAYWRGRNFGKIAMLNRSIEFTLPYLNVV
jgi:hypothetical protein